MCFFCSLNAISREFVLFDSKWGESQEAGSHGDVVTYGFATENVEGQFVDFDSFFDQQNFQTEIVDSLAVWENVTNIRFVAGENENSADIRFGWRDIDGPGQILGQTLIPSDGPLENVIVSFDVNENWFLGGDAPRDKIDFSSTAIHEIGHAIGIDHSLATDALMNAIYSREIFSIQQDDIDAAVSKYGENEIVKVDVHRFYKPEVGGHFFTVDQVERDVVEKSDVFNSEGVGFEALEASAEGVEGTVPVYRFLKPSLGSHFFTAFELEKDVVADSDDFIFEGVGFRAFPDDSSATTPIYRFFNLDTGGHFFTGSDPEKEAILNIPQLRYEGIAFFAFTDEAI